MGTEQKTKKKKKKKKREHGEEEPLVDTDVKKKKKSKKVDEQEEEREDNVQDDEVSETTHKQRRRKESCGDSDWSERCEDNAEIIRARAVNKKGSVEEGEDQVTYKKKEKKREDNDEKTEDSEESDAHCKVKKKKKKNREAEEEVEIQSLSDSSTSFPVEEKKKRKKGENMYSPEEHTFAMPEIRERYVSEDDRERMDKKLKKKKRADKEGGREKADLYSSQRVSEEGTQMGDRGNWDEGKARENMPRSQKMVEEQERRAETISHSRRMEAEWQRLKKIMEEQERLKRTGTISHSRRMEAERERLKKRLSGGVSYLAYSGMLGWETDSTVDDQDNQDFTDDLYHQPRRVIQERMKILRNTGENEEHVVYREGDAISGYVPCARFPGDSEDELAQITEVPYTHRGSPGFTVEQKNIPTLEEATYEFPAGAGIPEEEVEKVEDFENYWKIKDAALQQSNYMEEAKKYIDDKMQYNMDYFDRLLAGNLTPEELKETRPENYDDPFYPTPRQLEFLNTLNIVVDWPLSDLHQYYLNKYTIATYKSSGAWQAMDILVDTSPFTLRESKILARNWFAFQKEYGFYDLRPMVSARTARVLSFGDHLMVQQYEYLSLRNKLHFLLYLGKDLPHRTIDIIYKRIRRLLPFLRGKCLLRKKQQMTGLMLAKMQYVMEIFGADMLAAELLIGPPLSSFYKVSFVTWFMLRKVKLRMGPWTKEEDERLLKGIREVMNVPSEEEVYHQTRIPWLRILPYVRTRNPAYMSKRLAILANKSGESGSLAVLRAEMFKLVRLLHKKRVNNFRSANWDALANEVNATNPIKLVCTFKRMYFSMVPHRNRTTVAEGIKYMHDVILPHYEKHTHSFNKQLRRAQQQPDENVGDGGDPEIEVLSVNGQFPDFDDSRALEVIDGEREGSMTPSREGSDDGSSRIRREPSDVSSSEASDDDSGDLRSTDEVMGEQDDLDDPRPIKKVTKRRKNSGRNHIDDLPLNPRKMTHVDPTQLGKPSMQEMQENTRIPPKHDLETLFMNLSDSDDDLAWESEGQEL